jgi:hypothetical protein
MISPPQGPYLQWKVESITTAMGEREREANYSCQPDEPFPTRNASVWPSCHKASTQQPPPPVTYPGRGGGVFRLGIGGQWRWRDQVAELRRCGWCNAAGMVMPHRRSVARVRVPSLSRAVARLDIGGWGDGRSRRWWEAAGAPPDPQVTSGAGGEGRSSSSRWIQRGGRHHDSCSLGLTRNRYPFPTAGSCSVTHSSQYITCFLFLILTLTEDTPRF